MYRSFSGDASPVRSPNLEQAHGPPDFSEVLSNRTGDDMVTMYFLVFSL